MRLKILAGTSYNKGKSFEAVIVNILDKIGYTNILPRIRSTGSELDIKATHKGNGIRILCECKAQKALTKPLELMKFYAKFEKEKNNGKAENGYFISLSGYTSASETWYDELADETKKVFFILDSKKIIDLLLGTGILPTTRTVSIETKKNTSYEVAEKIILFFQSNLYIIQLLKKKNDIVAFIILDNNCKPVNFHISTEISRLDSELKAYTRIDPIIIEKVVLNLLDMKQKTLDQISFEIGETTGDCHIAIDDLLMQNLVRSRNLKWYRIDKSITSLETFVKKFQSTKNIYNFMTSEYINVVISDRFVKYVLNRYKIKLDEGFSNTLKKCTTIFPSALSLLLFGDVGTFNYTNSRLRTLESSEAKKEITDILLSVFWQHIYDAVLSDLRSSPTSYISDKGIKGYLRTGDLRVGSGTEMILRLFVKGYTYVAKKGKEQVKAGEILSPIDIGENINMGIHLYSLEEYDGANKYYDYVIKHSTDDDLLAHAWNNKSQCHRMMAQHTDEEICLLNAMLHVSPIIETVLSNLILCQESLGKTDMALKIKELLH